MSEVELQDLHPSRDDILSDVIRGLRAPQKWIAPMYFYDARGSALFDRICELPEYYPTRTELGILSADGAAIAASIGPRVLLIEPGSAGGDKARVLLNLLDDPAAYVPVEISREHLLDGARALNDEFPALEVLPVCADFTRPFDLPEPRQVVNRRVVFFPGSTIGNFSPARAVELLAHFANIASDDGRILIGVDLRKDPATLERAYNDDTGITAEFNLNVLHRLNAELGADFDVEAFSHRAVWNDTASRIEMHLVSKHAQTVRLGRERITLTDGEYIHTESSYKYSLEGFAALAGRAGLSVVEVWTDPQTLFSVQLLQPSGGV
ncbi:MAG: L-histidine N(alpha)-methyltransferase [Gammaproteobacteria bacterium]